jgi:hypothetical protein
MTIHLGNVNRCDVLEISVSANRGQFHSIQIASVNRDEDAITLQYSIRLQQTTSPSRILGLTISYFVEFSPLLISLWFFISL